MSLQSMLKGLVDAGVEFVVIGGVAAVAHWSPFLTNDLDICYASSAANVKRLVALLRAWNAYPGGWEKGLPFDVDARTFSTTPTLTLGTSEGELDLLDRVSGLDGYDTALEHSEEFRALGLTFRALGLRALIRAKESTGAGEGYRSASDVAGDVGSTGTRVEEYLGLESRALRTWASF